MFLSLLPLFILSVLSEASPGKRATTASAHCSNSDGSYKLSSIAAPVQGSGSPSSESTWKLSIDDTSSGHKQTIVGFGAAVTDATVTSFNTLPISMLQQLLNELMTGAGAGFTLMRHTIGASDLSGDPSYTYDDNGNNADPSLSGFNLGDRGNAMATMLAKMKSLQSSLKILGSPWSAPGWMKLNHVIDGTTKDNNLNDGYLTSGGTGSTGYASAFAQYFVKYIQAYQKLGAHIDAITIQNEPLNSQAGYPTMYMFDYESAQLIQNYIGPALAQAGLNTDIWAYDHNTDVPSYPQNVINTAGQYVHSVAWHCYASNVDWTVLTQFHQTNPNIKQYMTECWTPASASWNQAADFTMGPLQNWASGVTAWTLGTNDQDGPHLSTGGCANCRGLVTISNGGYIFNPAYYMMAQFSKFMPPGAIVLSGTGSYTYSDGGGVQSVASLNPDGTRSVVIENTFNNDIYITLSTNSDQQWSGSIPSQSVTTWVLPAV
ncbi:Glycoside hydrolase family 30 [Penicillium cf. griseofulvum]|uniref:glucan endo-1,6-beta-glucosidase n=1 Tax=Penicillium cf. griseofulvum TaxID=2972120 RepID=A0A9W9JNL8_9EURO|nr:Glycoside hydrolase family 30 [Penicillium cf. griseofulvum]KAJ5442092.1 Glycoside hydrolase family 30 [Penicillium cf. griseofulvum]KAJ5450936.1 Glycoside hydrolase family 30 [Penicillium cf. griseofulvum]